MSNSISEEKFINQLEQVQDYLPDTIVNLYDLSVLIGACNTAETSVKYNIPIETVMYSTVEYPIQNIGESDSLLELHFETTNKNNLKFTGSSLRPFTEEDMLNHPYYRKDMGTARSLTQRSSEDSFEDLFERTNGYTHHSAINNILIDWVELAEKNSEYNPDWMQSLSQIERFDETWINIEKTIRQELQSSVPYSGFISITIDGKSPAELDKYMDIFQDIVLAEQNEMNGFTSKGESVDMITRNQQEVLGVSNILPWGDYQSSKIREEYPNLNPKNGWRHRPISFETGLLMQESQSIFKNLNYYMSIGDTSPIEFSYYLLPYQSGEYTFSKLYTWWQDIKQIQSLSGMNKLKFVFNIANPVETDEFELFDDSETLEYDSVFTSLQKEGGNKKKELSVETIKYNRIREIQQIINKNRNEFDEVINLSNFTFEDASILDENVSSKELGVTVFNPYWYSNNMCGRKRTIPSASSIEFMLPRAFLFGEKIDTQQILRSFVERQRYLLHQTDEYGDATYYRYLKTISKQHVLFTTLSELNLLQTQRFNNQEVDSKNMDLELLDDTNISGDAKYPYLLGNLVGGLSYIQNENDVSQLAYMQYSVDYLSKQSFQETVSEVFTKIFQYSNKSNSSEYLLEKQYDTQALQKALTESPNPTDWNITETELQYYYSLGIVDGLTYSE